MSIWGVHAPIQRSCGSSGTCGADRQNGRLLFSPFITTKGSETAGGDRSEAIIGLLRTLTSRSLASIPTAVVDNACQGRARGRPFHYFGIKGLRGSSLWPDVVDGGGGFLYPSKWLGGRNLRFLYQRGMYWSDDNASGRSRCKTSSFS